MAATPFLVTRDDQADFWAVVEGIHVRLYRQSKGSQQRQLVLDIPLDRLRALLQWADKFHLHVAVSGPLAQEVRRQSEQLGVTTETFVITALNAFLQAGREQERRF